MRWATFGAVVLLICSGCILPVPHQRMHAYGAVGTIIDSESGSPVPYATIIALAPVRVANSDDQGCFTIESARGWHGAYFIGALSFSLLPEFDIPWRDCRLIVTADGYEPREVRCDTSITATNLPTYPPDEPVRLPATGEGEYLRITDPIRLRRYRKFDMQPCAAVQ